MVMDSILAALKSGHTRFEARFAKRDNAEGDAPDWSQPSVVQLRVYLREKDLRVRSRLLPKGQLLTVTPDGMPWAEYSEGDYCGNGEFLVEEWRMQLLRPA